MLNFFKKITVCVVLAITFSSCVNFNRFETAETLGARNKSFEMNQGVSVLGDSRSTTENVIPSTELTFRRGITDKLDLGITIPLSTLLLFDGKYNFYQSANKKFQASASPGFGYYLIKLNNGHPYLLTFPVIASYRFSDELAIGIIPKYVRFATQDNDKRIMNVFGAATGVAIGEDKSWNVSFGMYYSYERSRGTYYDQYWFGQFTIGKKIFYHRKKIANTGDDLKGG